MARQRGDYAIEGRGYRGRTIRLACCECGLGHYLVFSRVVTTRIFKDPEATKMARAAYAKEGRIKRASK